LALEFNFLHSKPLSTQQKTGGAIVQRTKIEGFALVWACPALRPVQPLLPAFCAVSAMPLFWKPYLSDASQFINELKAQKPTLEAEQRAGRALLWDKPQSRADAAEFKAARVPQSAYVYFGKSQPAGK